jgi:O-antigen/teichoic acid export membrane protein
MKGQTIRSGSSLIEAAFYRGTAWLLVHQAFTRGVNFLAGIAIARLLTPLDFGLMNLATTFSHFVMAAGNIGVAQFLIYRPGEDRDYLTAGFWLGVSASFVLFLLQAVLAPAVAAFYGNPSVAPLMIVLGVSFFLIAPLGGIHQALLQKRMEYRKLVIPQIAMTLVGTAGTLVLAATGWGVWSLALPGLLAFPVSVLLTWRMCDFRPSRRLYREYWPHIFRYGRHVWGSDLVTFVNNNADYILIGKLLGATLLGLYSFAYAQSMMLVSLLIGVFSQVVFPIFARLQNQREELEAAYFRFLRMATAVIIPITFLQLIVADEFIRVLYGVKWTEAVTPFRCLLLYALGRSLALGAAEVLNAVGRPDRVFRYSLAMAPLFTLAVLVGARGGIVGVAAATGIVFGGSALILVGMVVRSLGWKWKSYGEAVQSAFRTAGVVVVAAGLVHFGAARAGLPDAIDLLLTLASGTTAHVVLLGFQFSEEARALGRHLLGWRSG